MYVGIIKGAFSRRKAPVAESAGGSGLGSDAWCCGLQSACVSDCRVYIPTCISRRISSGRLEDAGTVAVDA